MPEAQRDSGNDGFVSLIRPVAAAHSSVFTRVLKLKPLFCLRFATICKAFLRRLSATVPQFVRNVHVLFAAALRALVGGVCTGLVRRAVSFWRTPHDATIQAIV